ncbi:MAG: nucleotidyl transferase AbiEii/AbiGii toxin family protein [Prevotellaceae bacterium]|jgi:predicted nucleotidyltransferase component of viral defense system|nr:nucleotidyl transferase AbiEii/AbiGii toxin family protein [Prevotellaceae bacterium]
MNNNKHKLYLTHILTDIYSDRELAHYLGFKGGTALMLFYDLPRLSVDLDFNLIDTNYSEKVYQKVRNIVVKYGNIHDEAQKFFGDIFVLDYEYGERNLKIDISHRKENDEYEIKNFLGLGVKIMNISDMFAHKLVALLGRSETADRDIFDCWFFMKKQTPVNKQIVETITNKSFDGYLQNCIDAMENLPKRSLLYGLGELVADDIKSFVLNKLQQEIIMHLKMYQKFPVFKKN